MVPARGIRLRPTPNTNDDERHARGPHPWCRRKTLGGPLMDRHEETRCNTTRLIPLPSPDCSSGPERGTGRQNSLQGRPPQMPRAHSPSLQSPRSASTSRPKSPTSRASATSLPPRGNVSSRGAGVHRLMRHPRPQSDHHRIQEGNRTQSAERQPHRHGAGAQHHPGKATHGQHAGSLSDTPIGQIWPNLTSAPTTHAAQDPKR